MSDTSSKLQVAPRGAPGLLYGIEDKPPFKVAAPLSVQHLFAMFGATILGPILVNAGIGAEVIPVPVAICTSGIGTLIYQKITKKRSPIYLGSSFAFIAPMVAGYAVAGMGGMMTGLVAVGVIYLLAALAVHLIGTGWLDRLLPPVVVGGMIMVIGLGLAPSAISQMGLDGSATSWKQLVVAFITLGTAVLVMMYGKGFLGIIPFLVALVVGYIAAAFFGLVDFKPIIEAAWIQVPSFHIMFVHYAPNLNAVWQIAPIAMATLAEHIGDHEAMSTISGRDLLRDPGLALTLLGDGLATLIAILLGSMPNTSYGENTAVAGITKIASVSVLTGAAYLAIAVSFMGKFAAIIASTPPCVLGGVSVLLYGFIGLNGAKVWVRHRVDFNVRRNVIVTAVMLTFGLGGAILAIKLGSLSVSFSGMSLAAVFGVLLNLLPKNQEDRAYEQRQIEEKKNQKRLEVLLTFPQIVELMDQTVTELEAKQKAEQEAIQDKTQGTAAS